MTLYTKRIMTEINEIYVKDCFEFLAGLEDGTADLAVIDPPYNLKKAEWDIFPSRDKFLEFTFTWIDALVPKMKENSSLYVFNTPFNCAFILPHLIGVGFDVRNWITWDKRDGFAPASRKYANGQETILFVTKGSKYTFNHDDIRLPYESVERIAHAQKKGILKAGKRWFPNPKGKLCGEVWHFSSERHKNKLNGRTQIMPHVTPKPLDMVKRIILASSNPGDIILDCFVGIGTTAVAAKMLGRNYICCDSNKEYVSIAKQRLEKTTQEIPL